MGVRTKTKALLSGIVSVFTRGCITAVLQPAVGYDKKKKRKVWKRSFYTTYNLNDFHKG